MNGDNQYPRTPTDPMRVANPAVSQIERLTNQPSAPVQQMPVGDIHTMPEKFLSAQHSRVTVGGGGSGKRTAVLIIVLILVLGALTAGAYFYLQSPNNILTGNTSKKTVVANQNTNAVTTPTEPVAPTNTNVSSPDAQARDTQRVNDLTTLAKALDAYYKKFGSYPQFLSMIPSDILATIPNDPSTQASYTYTPDAARQSYSILFDIEEQAVLNGKSVTKGTWQASPEDFNGTATSTPPETQQPAATDLSIQGSVDADGDGLTAAEEHIFTTSPNSDDTDSDGYKDLAEIKNFYSPVQSGNAKLDQSGLIKKYTDTTDAYGFYYPSNWIVRAPVAGSRETLITSDTGEDFSITVSDNPDNKTSWEWYTENVSTDTDQSHVAIVTVAGHEAVRTLDNLKIYVAVGSRVWSIVYNLNSASKVEYANIFDLIIDRLTIS